MSVAVAVDVQTLVALLPCMSVAVNVDGQTVILVQCKKKTTAFRTLVNLSRHGGPYSLCLCTANT